MPAEIYILIFQWAALRLRDIINLMTVSKHLYRISLLPDNWLIISDTKKILYDFVRRIFKSGSLYPINKIQMMCTIDYSDLLPIMITKQEEFTQFYQHFTNYHYLYLTTTVDIKTVRNTNIVFKGIYIYHYHNRSEYELFQLNSVLKAIT
jgi:hypothetical protein